MARQGQLTQKLHRRKERGTNGTPLRKGGRVRARFPTNGRGTQSKKMLAPTNSNAIPRACPASMPLAITLPDSPPRERAYGLSGRPAGRFDACHLPRAWLDTPTPARPIPYVIAPSPDLGTTSTPWRSKNPLPREPLYHGFFNSKITQGFGLYLARFLLSPPHPPSALAPPPRPPPCIHLAPS